MLETTSSKVSPHFKPYLHIFPRTPVINSSAPHFLTELCIIVYNLLCKANNRALFCVRYTDVSRARSNVLDTSGSTKYFDIQSPLIGQFTMEQNTSLYNTPVFATLRTRIEIFFISFRIRFCDQEFLRKG